MDEQLGIAGSGAIATGLAVCAARVGEPILWARSEASAQRARKQIAKSCERLGDEYDAGQACGSSPISTRSRTRRSSSRRSPRTRRSRASLLAQLGRARRPARDHRDDDLVAVGHRARRGLRPAGAVRRPARLQPGREDAARRARLSRSEASETTRERAAGAVRRARQGGRRGPRPRGLRRQPAAVPLPLQRRRLHGAHGPRAAGDRHLHAARRRAPDGADRAAGLHRARRLRRDRRRDRGRRAAAPARPLRRGRARAQGRPRPVPRRGLREASRRA